MKKLLVLLAIAVCSSADLIPGTMSEAHATNSTQNGGTPPNDGPIDINPWDPDTLIEPGEILNPLSIQEQCIVDCLTDNFDEYLECLNSPDPSMCGPIKDFKDSQCDDLCDPNVRDRRLA